MSNFSKEDAYCTLLMNDGYLPGVLAVAHSLRQAETKKQIVILATNRNLSERTLQEIKNAFDTVIDVENLTNADISQLSIMGREDLASTFTKLALWDQTQYRKLVYLDADTLPIRAPDELFEIDAPFAAAPELGFPDCFNSGVMVLEPNKEIYESLRQEAVKNGSFDGGDQGILNTCFPNFYRLSFLYNLELHQVYRLYMPAVLRSKDAISVVHFIGKKKPWNIDPYTALTDGSMYSELYKEMLEQWWQVGERFVLKAGY